MLAQSVFNFARLDPKTANLELLIQTPQKFDGAVGAVAGLVAGAVEPLARLGRERVSHKRLRGLFGLKQVAPRQSIAANEQFARHAHGDGVHKRIDDVEPGVADGPADGYRTGPPVVSPQVMGTGKGGTLGGAVPVDERAAGQLLSGPANVRGRGRFTPRE